jgi:hypothetical protein
MKNYIVELSGEERTSLKAVVKAKRMAAHKRKHAQILLKADQGHDGPNWDDKRIAQAFDCTVKTVERLRQRLIERGFENVLDHGNQGAVKIRKIHGEVEAHLVALACGLPPDGRRRWTVRLLADQMVALGYVDSCSKSAVHVALKKMSLNLI